MPRPMVPAPATPATRSVREASSMKGKIVFYGRPMAIIVTRRRERMKRVYRLALLALLALAAGAFAQPSGCAVPSRPITIICPWPAGGGTDMHLRKFAEIAQKLLGQ